MSGVRIERATVRRVLAERPGAVELEVDVEGREPPGALAIAYPALTGRPEPDDVVLLNTSAVALGLGTGGRHFVMAVLKDPLMPGAADAAEGHVMKLRYTPVQVPVLSVEEAASPHHAVMEAADLLDGLPVVWMPLHSMLGPVVAGARAAGAGRVAYVMTDGAALPAAFSRLARSLADVGLLSGTVTAGQSFGGDLEAVTAFSGLLAARHVLRADVIAIGDGPGNTGTRTAWGASNVASAMALNAAAILGGRPVAALRISEADARAEHHGVSHHSITALSRVALTPVTVPVPAIDDPVLRDEIWTRLREERLEERHQLVEANGAPALERLQSDGIVAESMGRGPNDDPAFFLSAGAAGIVAGRMAAGDRAWRDQARRDHAGRDGASG
jgi:hypothetical protein